MYLTQEMSGWARTAVSRLGRTGAGVTAGRGVRAAQGDDQERFSTMNETDEDRDAVEQDDEHTVTRYDQVEDAEALASVLHQLTNQLHQNGQIELSDRNKLYDRIDDALGHEVPADEVDYE